MVAATINLRACVLGSPSRTGCPQQQPSALVVGRRSPMRCSTLSRFLIATSLIVVPISQSALIVDRQPKSSRVTGIAVRTISSPKKSPLDLIIREGPVNGAHSL